MKKISVVALMVISLAFAAYAEAAKPKKRTRNANRVGPYATGFIGQTSYPNDQSLYEQLLIEEFAGLPEPPQNLTSSSEDSDLGYQAAFGYRFTRYLAAELALAQYGSAESRASADAVLDAGDPAVPVTLKLAFKTGGPVFSVLGILPVNDKFELFGRVGYLFASSEREFSSRVDGQSGGGFGPKGDSQDVVLGVGASYHFSQVYSLRLEYQQIDEVGDEAVTGVEDLRNIGLGFIVRF
jgi:opacity protein-like surface antigen